MMRRILGLIKLRKTGLMVKRGDGNGFTVNDRRVMKGDAGTIQA